MRFCICLCVSVCTNVCGYIMPAYTHIDICKGIRIYQYFFVTHRLISTVLSASISHTFFHCVTFFFFFPNDMGMLIWAQVCYYHSGN